MDTPKSKKDKCLLCKKTVLDQYWVYQWRQKSGYTCDECGRAIHDAGDKILESISGILGRSGVEDSYYKEKFGYYTYHGVAQSPEQLRIAEALFQQARRDFPEFTFSFSVWLRHTNVYVK